MDRINGGSGVFTSSRLPVDHPTDQLTDRPRDQLTVQPTDVDYRQDSSPLRDKENAKVERGEENKKDEDRRG